MESSIFNGPPVSDAEAAVRSSIQIFLAKKDNPKPEGFGSGCIVQYKERYFLLSVAHVVDANDLTVFVETNVTDEKGFPMIQPIGGICTFDMIRITNNMDLNEFEKLLEKGQRLDIAFAEIKGEMPALLQPEMDFKAFKVERSYKIFPYLEDAKVPTYEESYSFYGKVRQKYEEDGFRLHSTPTFKHSLKFHRVKGDFYMFLAPEIIRDKDDYRGTSGAPILDSTGSLVALACIVGENSKIVYGFSIQRCKELLNIAIATNQV